MARSGPLTPKGDTMYEFENICPECDNPVDADGWCLDSCKTQWCPDESLCESCSACVRCDGSC